MKSNKPAYTGERCMSCGKLLTDYEIFFGACACAMPIKPEKQPYQDGIHECLVNDSNCMSLGFCTNACVRSFNKDAL